MWDLLILLKNQEFLLRKFSELKKSRGFLIFTFSKVYKLSQIEGKGKPWNYYFSAVWVRETLFFNKYDLLFKE